MIITLSNNYDVTAPVAPLIGEYFGQGLEIYRFYGSGYFKSPTFNVRFLLKPHLKIKVRVNGRLFFDF